MHHKRTKSKRQVRCTLCTTHRWMGNHPDRSDHKTCRDAQDEGVTKLAGPASPTSRRARRAAKRQRRYVIERKATPAYLVERKTRPWGAWFEKHYPAPKDWTPMDHRHGSLNEAQWMVRKLRTEDHRFHYEYRVVDAHDGQVVFQDVV